MQYIVFKRSINMNFRILDKLFLFLAIASAKGIDINLISVLTGVFEGFISYALFSNSNHSDSFKTTSSLSKSKYSTLTSITQPDNYAVYSLFSSPQCPDEAGSGILYSTSGIGLNQCYQSDAHSRTSVRIAYSPNKDTILISYYDGSSCEGLATSVNSFKIGACLSALVNGNPASAKITIEDYVRLNYRENGLLAKYYASTNYCQDNAGALVGYYFTVASSDQCSDAVTRYRRDEYLLHAQPSISPFYENSSRHLTFSTKADCMPSAVNTPLATIFGYGPIFSCYKIPNPSAVFTKRYCFGGLETVMAQTRKRNQLMNTDLSEVNKMQWREKLVSDISIGDTILAYSGQLNTAVVADVVAVPHAKNRNFAVFQYILAVPYRDIFRSNTITKMPVSSVLDLDNNFSQNVSYLDYTNRFKKRSIRLTSDHLIHSVPCSTNFTNQQLFNSPELTAAGDVKVGDCIFVVPTSITYPNAICEFSDSRHENSSKNCTNVQKTPWRVISNERYYNNDGTYTFVTTQSSYGDMLLVNDVVVSPFAVNHVVSHLFYSFHRFVYRISRSMAQDSPNRCKSIYPFHLFCETFVRVVLTLGNGTLTIINSASLALAEYFSA